MKVLLLFLTLGFLQPPATPRKPTGRPAKVVKKNPCQPLSLNPLSQFANI